jgi:hypothetical protein
MCHIAVAAVDADDNATLMARLGRQADLDVGMLDMDVIGVVAMREAAGESTLTAHLEVVSSLTETAQRAMDDDDPHRTWISALMCAAAARRLAMLAGAVPDAQTASEIVAELTCSDVDEVSAPAGEAPSVPATLH